MKKKMIWVAGILIATSAYAQTDVSTGIMRGKDYGVTYLLPKTDRNCSTGYQTYIHARRVL